MTRPSILAACLAMTLCIGSARAQRPEPIDDAMKACLASDEGATTVGMHECYDRAAAAWDKRLTAAYAKLMRTLDPASKAALLTAERAWVSFREKDLAFRAAPWSQTTGTLAGVVFAANDVERIKARVYDLEFYLSGD